MCALTLYTDIQTFVHILTINVQGSYVKAHQKHYISIPAPFTGPAGRQASMLVLPVMQPYRCKHTGPAAQTLQLACENSCPAPILAPSPTPPQPYTAPYL